MVVGLFKNLNTTIMPGFHLQNALSNEFQMYLADGVSVLDPRKLKNAVDIYTNKTPDKMIKLGKTNLSHRQIKRTCRSMVFWIIHSSKKI